MLLKRIALKQDGNYYCINFLQSFRTEYKLKLHEKVWKYYD